jgi:molybdopterin-containing oxidoreductase family iron-sulfur binding subunit
MEKQTETDFTPPRHWLGPEELNPGYWSDPATLERRGQEFHDKPIETLSLIEKLDTKGVARRDFLTLMGASMAMASFACARRPVHKIIPYVVKPEEIVPGVANWYASTDPATGEGLLVKTREGRPIKLEGNPDHPINRGALLARTQASVLDLYDPDRLKEPMQGARGGTARSVTWSEADTAIRARLKEAASRGGAVRVLSAPVLGDSTRRLVQEFLASAGARGDGGSHVEFSPVFADELPEGQAECYGTALIPRFRFDEAEFIVSLGADFLGTWVSPIEHSGDWAKRRKLEGRDGAHAKLSRLVTYEPTMTITGANSDERYPVRPGDELKVALAIAHEIIVSQGRSRYAGDSQVAEALKGYRPEAVAAETGLVGGAEKLKAVAHALWNARGKSLVVAGGLQSKTRDALALQIAANLLNSALDNEGATVEGGKGTQLRPAGGYAQLEKLVGEMKAGKVEVLIIHRANPAYTLPKSAGFADGLARVRTVVYVGDRMDETASLADFSLPDHHYLENWGDANPREGVHSLQQPVIAPIHASRAFQDSLLAWSGKETSWHDYLRANWKETVFKQLGGGAAFEQFWEKVLQDGVVVDKAAAGRSAGRSFRTGALAKIPRFRPSGEGVALVLYSKISMFDGAQANNAWLQELPDPISTITWDNYLNVGTALAAKLGVKQNDVVEVTADDARVELPVNVQPGLHPQVVSAAIGYGRRAAGKVGNGVGQDLFPFVRAEGGRLVFSGQPVRLRKTGRAYKLAATQWHNASENRPVINDITLADYRKNPATANHTDPHLRMEEVPTIWPKHPFKGHRWGMAIDLNSCTGCGACVIGCQAENNVPVVGRANVRVSREMHWIRIDRYYSGPAENPDVLFQPMLCQHCENAPCETVCPVLATVHSDEGLNEQVYNRCVGTRYCQNNCPYKVRRFNFFDHWKAYEAELNLAWNPDVTVRTRGIMEKCTFCVQRIRDGKDAAKDAGVKLADGAIRTACQQACPTDAIVFGDMNDPASKVARAQGDPRAFRVLEILNTKASVSYLTKVRNKEKGAHGHGEAHS